MLEVGQRVYCKSDDLKLDNIQGVVTRNKVLGCEESVTVQLDDGRQVAFFGPKVNCVGKDGPLSKDPTQTTQAPSSTEKQVVKKRVTKKKINTT